MSARSCHQSGCHYQVLSMCHPPFSFNSQNSIKSEPVLHPQSKKKKKKKMMMMIVMMTIEGTKAESVFFFIKKLKIHFYKYPQSYLLILPVHAYTVTQSHKLKTPDKTWEGLEFFIHILLHIRQGLW